MGIMTSSTGTTNFRQILAARSTINGATEYLTSTLGVLNVNASVSITGVATAANQTNGSQKTQIVDGTGAVISSTSNSLNVNVTNASSGGTSALDNSAFTVGTTAGTPAMGFYHSTIDTVTDGRSATIGMTSKRAMFVNLQNASGTEVGTTGAPLQVSLANTGANATALLVTGTVTPSAPTTMLMGKTTVTTAGTRVVLASSTASVSVTVKALSTNTGFIYVGSSTVSASNGFQLSAGDTVSLDIANLNTVNIDSSVNGEGVTYLAVN